ncbi:MAG TPA: HPr-rel-A system PqqD family peptide chaperone [Allosphingosinicella sp.]|jgi:PqqD family protein of HPr-rel-A system
MAGPLYIADPDCLARIVELEGLTLLYHRRSGATHILAPPAPEILAALAGREGDAAAIAVRLGERFELAAGDAAAAIGARLAELEAAGLVRRA